MSTRWWPRVWAVLIALDAAVEMSAIRRGHPEATLSHAIRTGFRTDTPLGRLAFVSCWVSLTAWLLPHITTDSRGHG